MRRLFPKDVSLIVYRYVFDHNYRLVIEQYKREWLGGVECVHNLAHIPVALNNCIYWCDQDQTFVGKIAGGLGMSYAYMANWRSHSAYGRNRYNHINRLYSRAYVCKLPSRYYSNYDE